MRVLALIDMDSFYTQVEVKRDCSLRGQPVVVVQYNPYGDLRTLKATDVRVFPDSNGSIIASSYEARKFGVKRNMMAQAAKKLCPDLKIVQVPVAHGKADLTIYREAGAQVINVLSSGAVCERASIDEAYLDVTAGAQQMLAAAAAAASSTSKEQQQSKQLSTEQGQQGQQLHHQEPTQAVSTAPQSSCAVGEGDCVAAGSVLVALPASVEGWHVAGMAPGAAGVAEWWQQPSKSQDDQLLAAGAVIVAQLRAAVAQQLGFSCSAGIAHSKILAKLGAGLNKPAQQTLVPAAAVADLLNPLPISKLRALGGKFGEEIATSLSIQTVGELAAVPASRLEALVGEESAAWLSRLAQGIDDQEVKPRTLPKSISCGKTFRGGNAITGLSAVHKWLQELGQELQERIEADRKDHQRLPSLLTVSIDTLPGGSGAAAATGAAAAAAIASAVGENAAAAVAANGGRHTAQTWRAGVVNVSRSCGLRRPVAEVLAEDALKLVKKWARDRGQGWKIIGMFLSASNFVAAPTGASTLDRFMSAAAAGRQQQQQQQQQQTSSAGPVSPMSAAAAAAVGTGAGVADDGVDSLAEVQASLMMAAAGANPLSNSSTLAGTKRTAAAAGLNSSKGQPGGRNSSSRGGKRSYGDLRAFLGPSISTAQDGSDAAVPTPAEPATNSQQQEQPDRSPPSTAAGKPASTTAQSDADAVNAASSSIVAVPASAASSSPAGQARSVLMSLSRLAPAATAGSWIQQEQRQQPHMQPQQSGGKGHNLQQQQQDPQQKHDHTHDDVSGAAMVSAELSQACSVPLLPAAAGGPEQLSSLPSQVVGSLNGWLATSQQQTQPQQHEDDRILQGQSVPEGFEFKKVPEQQQHQRQRHQPDHHEEGRHQEHQQTAALRDPCALQQQPFASQCQVNLVDDAGAVQGTASDTSGAATSAAAGGAAAWQHPSLRMSDIDPGVLAELPYDIQMEVRRAAGQPAGTTPVGSNSSRAGRGRASKQPSRHRPAGSIAKFFSKGR